MDVLLILVLLLVFVTLVGHGIWSLIAHIFRAGKVAKTPEIPKQQVCLACGRPAMSPDGLCLACGHRATAFPRNAGDGLGSLSTHADRLMRMGVIDQPTHSRIAAVIHEEQKRLGIDFLKDWGDSTTPPPLPVLPLESAHPATPPSLPATNPVIIESDDDLIIVPAEPAKPETMAWVDQHLEPRTLVPESALRPPAPPRRTLSQMLASFMEESNIRWGELVGGLLIVGCSVALVVSFWADISHRPWLEFCLFTAVTAAFFGLGLYTEHRWRLPTTSRGILLIATLLVPLNFLAFAAFQGGAMPGMIALGAQIIAFAIFAYLGWQSAKVIAPIWPALLTTGICLLSANVSVFGCIDVGAVSGLRYFTLALICLASYAGLTVWMLARARRWRVIHTHPASAVLLAQGVFTFAAALAFGLLVHRSGHMADALRRLSLPLSLGGLPALATGMLLHRRVTNKQLSSFRTAGATLAVLGIMILVSGIVLAWPAPHEMLAISVADFIALTVVALLYDIAAAQWLALPCAILAWLIGFHLLHHDFHEPANGPHMIEVLCDALGGTALTPLVVLLGGVRGVLLRRRKILHAGIYTRVAAATALLSVILVSWAGFARAPDIYAATWVYAMYAVIAFGLTWRTTRPVFSWIGWSLLSAAIVQGFVSHRLTGQVWADSLLAIASLATLAQVALFASSRRSPAPSPGTPGEGWGEGSAESDPTTKDPHPNPLPEYREREPDPPWRILTQPARWIAVASVAACVVAALAGLDIDKALHPSLDIFASAVLLLLIATFDDTAALFIAGQVIMAGAVVLIVASRLLTRSWFVSSASPWIDPWTIQIEAISLTVVCLFWKVLRIAVVGPFTEAVSVGELDLNDVSASSSGRKLWAKSWLPVFGELLERAATFDRVLAGGLLLALLILVSIAIIPAIGVEYELDVIGRFGRDSLRAFGSGSWLVLVLLAVAFAIQGWQTLRRPVLVALLLTLWLTCPLLAARFVFIHGAASSLRWLCAAYLIGGFCPLWFRNYLPSLRILRHAPPTGPHSLSRAARVTLMVVGVVPIALLTLGPADLALDGSLIAGPSATSFFGRIGPAASYAIPLVAIGIVLVIEAIREKSPSYALWASAVFCAAATVAQLLVFASAGRSLDLGEVIRLLQINTIVVSGFAIAWLAFRYGVQQFGSEAGPIPAILVWQIRVGLILNGIIIVPAWLWLVMAPSLAGSLLAPVGGLWGYAALTLAVVTIVSAGAAQPDRLTIRLIALASMALAAMAGLSTITLWPGRGWAGFHVTLSAHMLAAYGLFCFGWWIVRRGAIGVILAQESAAPIPTTTDSMPLNYQTAEPAAIRLPVYFGGQLAQQAVVRWTSIIGLVVFLLAFRAVLGDPAGPWWSMGAAVAMSVLAVGIADWARRPGFLYPAALLLNFAAATWFWYRGSSAGWSGLDFISIQIVVAAIPGIAWLVLELQVFRHDASIVRRGLPAVHRVLVLATTSVAVIATTCVVASRLGGISIACNSLLMMLALLSSGALASACLFDQQAKSLGPALYALGLATLLYVVTLTAIPLNWLPWALVVTLACYNLLTSSIFVQKVRLLELGRQLGLPARKGDLDPWLANVSTILGVAILVAAIRADILLASIWGRLMVASVAIAQVFSLAMLARRRPESPIRAIALWILALGTIAWAWAWLPINQPEALQRSAIAFTLLSAFAWLFAVALPAVVRANNPWPAVARTQFVPILVLLAVCLLATFWAEGSYLSDHQGKSPHGVVLAVGLTLLLGCAAALRQAVAPRATSPAEPEAASQFCAIAVLSDRQRIYCVYGAEALLALLFVHLRISEPHLFRGIFQAFWPLIVMAIAFVGVGVADVFRRQGNRILSEPIERTGVFLPLLPIIGWWISPAAGVQYGMLLLSVAAFYGVVAVLRKSFVFAALAALAGNGALWDALSRSDSLGFAEHPQLWLIPGSICLLIGAHFNRENLPPARLRTIRYGCLIAIYVSSTADIFINGVSRAPWLPLVLAALSVVGVLGGIMLRIRPFLFLGTLFLGIAIITMIYYAFSEFHWTWIWYVAGIALGSGMITLFALFEKKRDNMLALVDGLRRWE